FKIIIEREAKHFNHQQNSTKETLHTINIAIRNPNLDGLLMQDIPLLNEDSLVCSRLKRGDDIMVPMPSTIIQLGDLLHIV
ncbi:transporter, partial [Enterobacter hormaechei]|nr:transporter [Enterobacter hormaechei]